MSVLPTFASLATDEQVRLREGIWPLPERERSIIEMRLGIYCLPHTHKECAAKLGCTASLVRELETRACYYLLNCSGIEDLAQTLFPDSTALEQE